MAKIMKVLLTLSMVAALAAVSLAQTQTAKPEAGKADKAKVLAMLQGAWVFTSANGEELTNGPEIVVTITDDKYVQVTNGGVVERGSFTFDVTKKPMTMDITITEGDEAGRKQLGIFEVTATTMRGNLNEAGATVRPTDFTPAEGLFSFTAKKK